MIYINDKMRVSRYDRYNLQIEILTETKNNSTKEISLVWKNDGYYNSLENALKGAYKKLLVDAVCDDTELVSLQDAIESVASTMSQVTERLANEIKEI